MWCCKPAMFEFVKCQVWLSRMMAGTRMMGMLLVRTLIDAVACRQVAAPIGGRSRAVAQWRGLLGSRGARATSRAHTRISGVSRTAAAAPPWPRGGSREAHEKDDSSGNVAHTCLRLRNAYAEEDLVRDAWSATTTEGWHFGPLCQSRPNTSHLMCTSLHSALNLRHAHVSHTLKTALCRAITFMLLNKVPN
jgi:hypothetical protein